MQPTLEELDRELANWRDRLAAASRNVAELSELPAYPAARALASGGGRTAEEAKKLTATMDELWQGLLLIGATLDRAEKARAAASRLWGGEEAAWRAMDILRGPSVVVDLADTPVLHRRLLAGPRATATVSPDELLQTMDAAFDRARERFVRITEGAAQADALRDTLTKQIAMLPGSPALAARLAAASLPDPLDRLDALEALRADIEAAVAATTHAREACAAARQSVATLADAAAQASSLVERCRAAVAIDLPPVRENAAAELSEWLDGIERTLASGRAEACAVGLTNWNAAHDRAAAEVARASAAAGAALARVEELRGRLGALRIKHRTRVVPEGNALATAACDALAHPPVDLDLAAQKVAAFQAALARG